jgi:hypothetical protein
MGSTVHSLPTILSTRVQHPIHARPSDLGAVGQAEREAMLERQREGIAKAKWEGR